MALPVIFLGSPSFAVPSLRALDEDDRIDVRLVVTQPNRPAGRKRRLHPSPVKDAAIERGLTVFQPEQVNDPTSLNRIAQFEPVVGVLVAYGEFLSRSLLRLPDKGFLNLHPSILPLYRGASPVQAAILNGDTETGISIIEMTRKLDAGPVLHQRVVPLAGSETSGMLSDRLAHIGAIDLPDVVVDWVEGRIDAKPQDDAEASHTRELSKADGEINWEESAIEIERFVRAMEPWPGAWTEFDGQRLSVSATKLSGAEGPEPPGSIKVGSGGVAISTGAGWLELVEVQPAGKRAMPAADWARGARIVDGARFRRTRS